MLEFICDCADSLSLFIHTKTKRVNKQKKTHVALTHTPWIYKCMCTLMFALILSCRNIEIILKNKQKNNKKIIKRKKLTGRLTWYIIYYLKKKNPDMSNSHDSTPS